MEETMRKLFVTLTASGLAIMAASLAGGALANPDGISGAWKRAALASFISMDVVEIDRHPWNRLAWFGGFGYPRAVPLYLVPLMESAPVRHEPETRMAGGWRFCHSTDYVGDGYGIFCVGAARSETRLAGIALNALD
jgi:hypothetical protein